MRRGRQRGKFHLRADKDVPNWRHRALGAGRLAALRDRVGGLRAGPLGDGDAAKDQRDAAYQRSPSDIHWIAVAMRRHITVIGRDYDLPNRRHRYPTSPSGVPISFDMPSDLPRNFKSGPVPDNLFWHTATVTRRRRERQNCHKSAIVWFTGLSGAGKSTIAHATEEALHRSGCRTF